MLLKDDAKNHKCKESLAVMAACDKYSFSSDNFGIIFSQIESKMWQKCDKIGNN